MQTINALYLFPFPLLLAIVIICSLHLYSRCSLLYIYVYAYVWFEVNQHRLTMDRYKNKAIHCWTWQIFIISFCSWAIFLFPFSSLIPFRRMELKFFSSVDFMNWDRISIHEIHENHETFREQTVFGDKLRICFNSVIPYYFR